MCVEVSGPHVVVSFSLQQMCTEVQSQVIRFGAKSLQQLNNIMDPRSRRNLVIVQNFQLFASIKVLCMYKLSCTFAGSPLTLIWLLPLTCSVCNRTHYVLIMVFTILRTKKEHIFFPLQKLFIRNGHFLFSTFIFKSSVTLSSLMTEM